MGGSAPPAHSPYLDAILQGARHVALSVLWLIDDGSPSVRVPFRSVDELDVEILAVAVPGRSGRDKAIRKLSGSNRSRRAACLILGSFAGLRTSSAWPHPTLVNKTSRPSFDRICTMNDD